MNIQSLLDMPVTEHTTQNVVQEAMQTFSNDPVVKKQQSEEVSERSYEYVEGSR